MNLKQGRPEVLVKIKFVEIREIRSSHMAMLEEDIDRIIEMALEDRTPFEAIQFQFGLTESTVRILMKSTLTSGSYRAWRKRVEKKNTKHLLKRSESIRRFRSTRQRSISGNKISKSQ